MAAATRVSVSDRLSAKTIDRLSSRSAERPVSGQYRAINVGGRSNSINNSTVAISFPDREYTSRYGAIALDSVTIKEDYLAYERYSNEGHWFWKLLGLLAGSAVSIVFLCALVANIKSVTPFEAVVDVYMALMGAGFCLLEYKEMLCSAQCNDAMKAAVPFLCRPQGRACCYVLLGVLVASLGHGWGLAVGLYAVLTGAVVFLLASSNQRTLQRLRGSCADANGPSIRIQQEFDI